MIKDRGSNFKITSQELVKKFILKMDKHPNQILF